MNQEIVSAMINSWLAERETRSITSLSKLSGVSDASLRRAQSKSGKPDLATIICIGRATGKTEMMNQAIEQYYPNCVDAIIKTKMADGLPIEADTTEFFEDGVSTSQFISLYARKGLNRKTLIENFGKKGANLADRFVALELATEQADGSLIPTSKWYSYKSPSELLKAIRNLNVDFDVEKLGSKFARINLLTESVNEESAAKIQSIVDESISAIRQILDNPNSAGENLIAVSTVMQSLKN